VQTIVAFLFLNNFATWRKFIYKKKVVGTKLAWKQTCQIYLPGDKNMECTLTRTAKQQTARTANI